VSFRGNGSKVMSRKRGKRQANRGPTRQSRRHGHAAAKPSGPWAWLRAHVGVSTIGWVLVLAFLGYRFWPQVGAMFGVGGSGEAATSFTLRTLDGQKVSLDQYRGDVVLVNFWATWCPPCRFEMPGFEKVYREKKDRGFRIVGVSMDETGAAGVRRYLAQHGITYPVGMVNGGVFRAFGSPTTLPASFLIDRQGRIRHHVTGVFAEVTLSQAVDRLLKEPGPGPQASR
jgi:cytochrome c biogenesis protein CcmG, thiol:disulfide interchange protein DsbE